MDRYILALAVVLVAAPVKAQPAMGLYPTASELATKRLRFAAALVGAR